MHDAYESLGQNPATIPEGDWVRVFVSGTGNVETWVEHTLKLPYQRICD